MQFQTFSSSEVGSYVVAESEIYPEHTFRNNGVCMSCHITLDNAAAVARNFHMALIGAAGTVQSATFSISQKNDGTEEVKINEEFVDNLLRLWPYLKQTSSDKSSTEANIDEYQIYPDGSLTCTSVNNNYNCDIDSNNDCIATDYDSNLVSCTMINENCLTDVSNSETAICERIFDEASRFENNFNRMEAKGTFLLKMFTV